MADPPHHYIDTGDHTGSGRDRSGAADTEHP